MPDTVNHASYVLHRGDSRSSYEFSDCSLRNISSVIKALRHSGKNCLHRVPASVCGNGVVEAWEECDCGEDGDCACCFPGDDQRGRGCQLKSHAYCRYGTFERVPTRQNRVSFA